jgi:hypothetical protein
VDARRRALLWALVIAIGLGFAAGWFARFLWEPSQESRARSTMDDMRERARRFFR